MSVLVSLLHSLRFVLRSRASLHLEILALRHQLTVVHRSRRPRLRLTAMDRMLWASLSHVWHRWRSALHLVKPATVIAWHRRGFRLFWTWKSRRRTGRPCVPKDVRVLIRELSSQNPLWGAPRIHGELQKLSISVSQSTVAEYIRHQPTTPSQSWRTFLTNHAGQIMAADFFVVPTVTFRLLFVLVVLAHDRRRIVHVAVTDHPTAEWTAQQLRNAFPDDQAPRYLVHDRDGAFAAVRRASGSSGTSSANSLTDAKGLLAGFFASDPDPTAAHWIMSPRTASALAIAANSSTLTVAGGTFLGLPAIVSASAGARIAIIDAGQLLVADAGDLSIDVARHATVELNTVATSPISAASVYVSLWQAGLVGLKCQRTINWKIKPSAAIYTVVSYT